MTWGLVAHRRVGIIPQCSIAFFGVPQSLPAYASSKGFVTPPRLGWRV